MNLEKARRDVVEHLERMGYIKDQRIKRAMLKHLKRLSIAHFKLKDAHTLEEIKKLMKISKLEMKII